MQLKQFSGVNLEENLDSFDKWADLFQKMPMFYMTFFGANEVSSSTYWVFTFHLFTKINLTNPLKFAYQITANHY